MGGSCGTEKTEGKILVCREAVTTFFDRKVHFTSQRLLFFFSATVTLPTHFTVNSFEGKEKECLMQTHVMEMSVQSIRIAEAGSKALRHKVHNC